MIGSISYRQAGHRWPTPARLSQRGARALRATVAVGALTLAGTAWNGLLVASLVWYLAVGSGHAAPVSLLIGVAFATGKILVVPIGTVIGLAFRSWLQAEDRLAERRRIFVRP